jgi:cytoskeletal protein RodZ
MTVDTSKLAQEQQEYLTEVGAYLRQLREQSHLSLDEVATRTWIRVGLLRAIEDGQMHRLPEPVYIKGFIKRYADALEQDGTAFAEAFPIQTVRPVPSFWRLSPAIPLRPLHLYFAYVALIMAAISGLSYAIDRQSPLTSRQVQPTAPNLPAIATAEPETPNATPTAVTGLQTNPPNPITDKSVRVTVTLTAQSWMRVEVDGTTDFEGILPEGTQRTWTGDQQVVLRAGNAGGVSVAYNEGEATPLGEPGAVEEVTFSSDSPPNTAQTAALTTSRLP